MGRDGEPGSLAGEPARVSRLANGAADGESLAQLDAGRRKPMLIQTDGGTDRREQGAFHTARAQRRRRAAQTPAPGRWIESRRRLRPSTSVGRLPLRRPARSNLRYKKIYRSAASCGSWKRGCWAYSCTRVSLRIV